MPGELSVVAILAADGRHICQAAIQKGQADATEAVEANAQRTRVTVRPRTCKPLLENRCDVLEERDRIGHTQVPRIFAPPDLTAGRTVDQCVQRLMDAGGEDHKIRARIVLRRSPLLDALQYISICGQIGGLIAYRKDRTAHLAGPLQHFRECDKAHALACGIHNHKRNDTRHVAWRRSLDMVAHHGGAELVAEHPLACDDVHPAEDGRDVFQRGGAQREGGLLLGRQGCKRGKRHERVVVQLHRHGVADLSIEVGNAGNGLHHVAKRSAACVHHVKESAHKAACAVVGQGAHKFRPANRERNTLVAPRLRNEERSRGDQVIVRRVHHDEDVVKRDRGVPLHEITRPNAQPLLHVGRVILAIDHCVEIGQPVDVGCVPFTQRAQDEAVG